MIEIVDCNLVFNLSLFALDGEFPVSADAYGHSCTVTGAKWCFGGFYFDGVDDGINCSANDVLNPAYNQVTVVAWLKPELASTYQRLVQKTYGSPQYANYALELLSDNKIRLRVGDGASFHNFDSIGKLEAGNWYHVAASYDGSRGKVYINGLIDNATEDAFTVATATNSLELGSLAGNNPYGGQMGEVRVYNRALTPLEIQHDYLTPKRRRR